MCNNNIFFHCLRSALMEEHDFFYSVIPWNCTWYCTVHDTVQYRYRILSLLYCLLRIRLKHPNPLLSCVQERERNYTVNVQCSVQYTLLLPYLMLVMSVCNIPIKLYHIYVCYMNITLYHVMYSVRYYPQFHVTTVGLGMYYSWIWGSAYKWNFKLLPAMDKVCLINWTTQDAMVSSSTSCLYELWSEIWKLNWQHSKDGRHR